MLSKEEMIKLLAEEYGIHNDKELDEALERVAINMAIFVTPVEKSNEKIDIQGVP